ncbi:uncharacterized protein LOC100678713 isoform X3 [Nasonia vitripennis]|uniref:Transposase domain-containing protein n=1 Tax=Nasonia vitripennis TaxID=7425 RepID=A0A7M7TEL9_NASVI|nr:uncharacterized protein LOC100678713 isoform X3 [Nasonia vitripennis]XP_016845171.2 uncharacterized protein LOC100679894 isoform X3 [Nasonia vitripennis]XP_032457946.1 uncharacterized protein LOC100679894 isoform X3 [Nasonia vitripennis]XP_032457974.1 uncharacterized protein LOC100678713 isoform X3 [Nasonia vitripennis]XP_032457975.1 uncharacterized protein LOC100678713 isoform X3 [Nasonia vitripennis]
MQEADHSCITFNDNEADYINDVTNRPMEQHMELDNEQDMMSMEFENDLEYYLHTILLEDRFEKSSQSFQDPKNLEELLNSPTLLEPASSDPVNVSKGELLLMILKFSMNNNLSVTGMTNLFKLINTIFETSIMPNSRYLADKLFNPMDKAEFHAVCPNCTAYIGKFGEIENVRNCRICTLELDLSNPSNTSYFILLNPSSQIKDIISIYQDHYEYVIKERVREPNSISDVYDSKEYIKFVDSLPEQDKSNYISAVFNTDGANKFKCSKYSIWPLFLMLNELPKQERMSKLITCGLFFNKHKPDMTVFLGTFVDMMNRLTKDGIPCVINAKDRLLKLHIISSCVDSVARAPIQGIKQFNGRCACSWCLHPGVWVEDAMKYPLLTTSINPRDHESTINDMMTATPDRPINGIKYPSPLINLTSFNIISGFVPDYMHCCLEGVAKQLTEYHISSMNNDDIREIDSKINKITAPHQISKLSRPLSCRNDWKAREWENYILYYSVVVLPEHLSRNHYYHWLLFVESLYILLQDKINITELNRADEMLHIFVADTEKYFGQKAMTYNVHQLLHLSTSVLNWGPLWCHSTFSFESGNHILLKAIKSSKGVPYQITRFIQINHTATVLQEHVYVMTFWIQRFKIVVKYQI